MFLKLGSRATPPASASCPGCPDCQGNMCPQLSAPPYPLVMRMVHTDQGASCHRLVYSSWGEGAVPSGLPPSAGRCPDECKHFPFRAAFGLPAPVSSLYVTCKIGIPIFYRALLPACEGQLHTPPHSPPHRLTPHSFLWGTGPRPWNEERVSPRAPSQRLTLPLAPLWQ